MVPGPASSLVPRLDFLAPTAASKSLNIVSHCSLVYEINVSVYGSRGANVQYKADLCARFATVLIFFI